MIGDHQHIRLGAGDLHHLSHDFVDAQPKVANGRSQFFRQQRIVSGKRWIRELPVEVLDFIGAGEDDPEEIPLLIIQKIFRYRGLPLETQLESFEQKLLETRAKPFTKGIERIETELWFQI